MLIVPSPLLLKQLRNNKGHSCGFCTVGGGKSKVGEREE